MSLASPAASGVTASSIRSILDQCIAENMAAIQINNDKAFLTRSFAARSVCEDIRAQLADYHDDDLVDVAAIRLPDETDLDFLPAELRSMFDYGSHPSANVSEPVVPIPMFGSSETNGASPSRKHGSTPTESRRASRSSRRASEKSRSASRSPSRPKSIIPVAQQDQQQAAAATPVSPSYPERLSGISNASISSGKSATLRARVAERTRQVAEAKLALAEAQLHEDIVALESAAASDDNSKTSRSEKRQQEPSQTKSGHFGPTAEESYQPPVEHAVSYAPGAIAGDTQPSPFVFTGLNPFSSNLPHNNAFVENLRNIEQQQRPISHGGHGDSCSASHNVEIKPLAATGAAVSTVAMAAAGSLLDGAMQFVDPRLAHFSAFLRGAGPDQASGRENLADSQSQQLPAQSGANGNEQQLLGNLLQFGSPPGLPEVTPLLAQSSYASCDDGLPLGADHAMTLPGPQRRGLHQVNRTLTLSGLRGLAEKQFTLDEKVGKALTSGGVDRKERTLREQLLREHISKIQAELDGVTLQAAGRAGLETLGPEDARPGQILPEY